MGIFRALRLTRAAASLDNVVQFPVSQLAGGGVSSPWSEGQLNKFVYSDVFGDATLYPPTRAEAMSLPAVVNGRALIIGELARRQLRAVRGGNPIPDQPAWLYRTSGDVPPWHRMAGTLDDCIFYGDSLWIVERGKDDRISDAMRCPRDYWQINSEGQIEVFVGGEWRPAKRREVIYFAGPFEGLLNAAARTIRAAVNLEASWANRAATPLPSIILEQREQGELNETEISDVVTAVAEARRNPNGGVMFVPYEYLARVEGQSDPSMLTEARNAVKLDVANFLAIDASNLDAALPKASLNYETEKGSQQAFQSRLPYWTAPLEARLSMDDVCPRGQAIRFDFSDNPTEAGGETGPFTED